MAQIIKRTTAKGEFRYDVRTRINGRLVMRTFKRRKDADVYATTLEADKLRGVVVDPRGSRIKLGEMADRWLKSRPAKRDSSLARDRVIVENHIKPALGERAIGSITRADVQKVVDTWAAQKAATTTRRQYACLRAVFALAEADDKLARNPCRGVRLPQTRLVSRPELTAEQLRKLADALDADDAVMMWLGVVLGLRWSEAAGLTVDRLDFPTGTVTVDRQLTRQGTLTVPKSEAGVRALATPDWLMEDLAAVLTRRSLTAADGDALLFVAAAGAPLSYTNWRSRVWVPARTKARLPGLRFHDLRSMNATALVAAGVDVKTAQRRLGHSNPQMTLAVYARATADADRQAAVAVGDRFRPRDGRAIDQGANLHIVRKMGA